MLPRLKVQERAFRSFLCATRGGVTVWGFEPNERPFLTLRRLARPADRNALQGCGFHHATRTSSEAFRRRFFFGKTGNEGETDVFPASVRKERFARKTADRRGRLRFQAGACLRPRPVRSRTPCRCCRGTPCRAELTALFRPAASSRTGENGPKSPASSHAERAGGCLPRPCGRSAFGCYFTLTLPSHTRPASGSTGR